MTPLEAAALIYQKASDQKDAAVQVHKDALATWRAGTREADTDRPVEDAHMAMISAMNDYQAAISNLLLIAYTYAKD